MMVAVSVYSSTNGVGGPIEWQETLLQRGSNKLPTDNRASMILRLKQILAGVNTPTGFQRDTRLRNNELRKTG